MTVENLCHKLEPILGDRITRLYKLWSIGNRQEKEEVEQVLQLLYLKHFKQPLDSPILFAPPLAETVCGEVELGTVCYNESLLYPFGLKTEELAQHLAIFGRSGSGKTNTVRVLIKGLLQQKKPFLIFDWKRDYSQLNFEAVFKGIGIRNHDITVLPVGKRNVKGLRMNPLIPPPGTAPETWAKQICEIFTHAYMGGPGFESLLLKAIDHAYQQNGVYENSGRYPTIADLKTYLENLRCTAREAQWLQSVMRTLNALCYGGINDTFNSSEPDSIEDLLKQNIILELDSISDADKTFLTESILLWLHHYRLENPPQNTVDNIIIIEEAHHLLRASTQSEESLVESSLREMRSLGIGIVIVDQMPSLISRVSLANTYCTIALNVKTGQDAQVLAQSMLLDREQKDMLGMLPIGQAVVKLQDRHLRPFHIQIPHLKTDGKRMFHYLPLSPEIPRIPPQNAVPEQNEPKIDRLPSPIIEEEPNTENQLLIDILKHPTDSVTARYKRLNLSARKGNHAKTKLIEKQFIEPVTFAGLHAWLRLFRITEQGKAYLKSLGAFEYSRRYGGLEHLYWQEQIQKFFEAQGYTIEREKRIQGHYVDLLATKGHETIAIEIETGRSHYLENIKHCLREQSLSKIIVACTNKDLADKICAETQIIHDQRLAVIEARRWLGGKK